jgi:hypothetical protein
VNCGRRSFRWAQAVLPKGNKLIAQGLEVLVAKPDSVLGEKRVVAVQTVLDSGTVVEEIGRLNPRTEVDFLWVVKPWVT